MNPRSWAQQFSMLTIAPPKPLVDKIDFSKKISINEMFIFYEYIFVPWLIYVYVLVVMNKMNLKVENDIHV